MTYRHTAFAAFTLAALAATPASAQQTFNAWGHVFDVPGSATQVSDVPAPRAFNALNARGSDAYYLVDRRAAPVVAAPVQEQRTLNVWGARIDAPAR
ncbi:hypothetical protein [Methylobacterium brachythecii]|uniref:Uncharacterized protein n=1 Tax=Methylobacterium brachythecii TaxID=1176177 RepID=A0A7W6F9E7_9HYPH|nr:hypothetical protein [Methylobacterium brachythecii]MBB3905435.1 hypothetical protein [Methylobacterium brachythecii]GLS44915.1 hypothetical protein GCM10007884_29040 [Methylobacterium brachythecii]